MIHSMSFAGSRAKFDRRISLETHDLECVRPTDRPEMGRWACTSRCPKVDEETIEFGFFQAWLRRSMVAPKPRATTPRKKPRRPVAARAGASSTRRRPGYPLSGCSAAEPDSVSPGKSDYSSEPQREWSKKFKTGRTRPPGLQCSKLGTQPCKGAHPDDTNRSSRTVRVAVRNGIETNVHLPNLTRPSLA